MTKPRIIIIAGPTASGKTDFSISVARAINGEIINGDAFQIYKGLNIGTAKITVHETKNIPHHLFDIRNPNETFSVSEYQELATQKIREIISRGKTPIIVGGTGLFLHSLLFGYKFGERAKNESIRTEYEELAQTKGLAYLYKLLETLDKEWANQIQPNDKKRIIRALEILRQGGKNPLNTQSEILFDCDFYCIDIDRNTLYNRINIRVDQMIEQGLLNEIKKLLSIGVSFQSQSMQAIGYKEWKEYFESNAKLDEIVERIKQNSRNYAKRQLTWFRNKEYVKWVKPEELNEIIKQLKKEKKNE